MTLKNQRFPKKFFKEFQGPRKSSLEIFWGFAPSTLKELASPLHMASLDMENKNAYNGGKS